MILPTRGWTRLLTTTALALGLAACSQDGSTPVDPGQDTGLSLSGKGRNSQSLEVRLTDLMASTNAALATQGADFRLGKIEAISGDPEQAGITVLWKNVGNKQLAHDFVVNDTRREWDADPNRISWAIDRGEGVTFNGVPEPTTSGEIEDAMATWAGTECGRSGLNQVEAPGVDLGLIAFLNGLGGSPTVVADIQHAGWLEIEFAGATIAATFTLIWIDDAGNPTDVDGNGLPDVALREIYYDAICQACAPVDFWNWEIDDGLNEPGREIDIESIALHESGHGLSQNHFGIGFTTHDGTILHETSDAVMGAAYAGPRTDLQGTDNGGHCSNWANWPNS
ncbi:MAG TPA: hypothetical protein VJ982_12425 [Gemmatimonadota bacterium]|nr:hypothetical protein [Gemmatimonadota bacterium]